MKLKFFNPRMKHKTLPDPEFIFPDVAIDLLDGTFDKKNQRLKTENIIVYNSKEAKYYKISKWNTN